MNKSKIANILHLFYCYTSQIVDELERFGTQWEVTEYGDVVFSTILSK